MIEEEKKKEEKRPSGEARRAREIEDKEKPRRASRLGRGRCEKRKGGREKTKTREV